MEKDEKTTINPIVDDTIEVNDTVVENPDEEQIDDNTAIEPEEAPVVPPVEDTTLAPTDDVIPAPVEAPETPVDVPADAPLADIVPPTFDVPVDPVPTDVPGEMPVEPAPVVSDVVPEVGDETPADCACCDNQDDCCGDECTVANPASITVGQYFGTLQESVTIVWRFHLKTRKHHVHVILNEFYEKALDIVDDIIEQYQGICGVVDEPYVNCVLGEGKSEGQYLTELKTFVETNRVNISNGHSEIDSAIDDFLGLIDSTNYKLTAFCEHAVKSFEEFVYEDYATIKESCKYDRYGERSCDDPDDPDYDPEFENGECGAEEE